MTIWLASGNVHKQKELAAILDGHSVLIPADAGIADFDPDERGSCFTENAVIKARALYAHPALFYRLSSRFIIIRRLLVWIMFQRKTLLL